MMLIRDSLLKLGRQGCRGASQYDLAEASFRAEFLLTRRPARISIFSRLRSSLCPYECG